MTLSRETWHRNTTNITTTTTTTTTKKKKNSPNHLKQNTPSKNKTTTTKCVAKVAEVQRPVCWPPLFAWHEFRSASFWTEGSSGLAAAHPMQSSCWVRREDVKAKWHVVVSKSTLTIMAMFHIFVKLKGKMALKIRMQL